MKLKKLSKIVIISTALTGNTLGFNIHILKQIKDEISPMLALVFNKCLQVDLFPDDLNIYKIIPI